ncbi:nudix hydrolase 20 [Carex littledalei]|uniref:Nudix hydrolase 20 n=1 Tax=Carex littledalei TaxID=544730 RepID=A0A833QT82_9POAL|nr:nudix hydrolase 20 [Carex littledalei]
MTLSERGEIISLAFLSILPFLSISKLTRIVARHYSPHGISCKKNIIKECEEEAGIPASISTNVIPVGAVSYMDIEGYRYKRDYCMDRKFALSKYSLAIDGLVEKAIELSLAQIR